MSDYCPVCGGPEVALFLKRDSVPVHQHLVSRDQDIARKMGRGQLDMAVCQSCGFVFNRLFDFSKLSYDESYDNAQSCSTHFNNYLDGLASYLVEQKNVRNSTIVEVGCGKGDFLRKLVEYPGANNKGVGLDPSYVGPDSELDGRLVFHKKYYDATSAGLDTDVVICRHVIEHVPEPLTLLSAVRSALDNSRDAKVYFETPCVDWILRNQVIWDFFYEHCSLFNIKSLSRAFTQAGFNVEDARHVFENQYLWLEAKLSFSKSIDEYSDLSAGPQKTIEMAVRYGKQEEQIRQKWQEYLQALKAEGAVALWGAGAKGVTLANLIDPYCKLIDCVVDLNPNKQSGFLPGTGHPIVSPELLGERGVKNAVQMNPNYRQENQHILDRLRLATKLVEL